MREPDGYLGIPLAIIAATIVVMTGWGVFVSYGSWQCRRAKEAYSDVGYWAAVTRAPELLKALELAKERRDKSCNAQGESA